MTFRACPHPQGWVWFVGGQVWLCRFQSLYVPDGVPADDLQRHKVKDLWHYHRFNTPS